MRNLNYISTHILAVAALFLFSMPNSLQAAPRTINKYLTKGQKLEIRSKRCILNIRSSSESKVDVRCGNRIQNGDTPRTTRSPLYLEPKGRAVITRKSCFLTSRLVGPKRVIIQCLAKRPVTPTATPTSTLNATPTGTPTPTATATPTANANLLLSSNNLLSLSTSFPAGAATPFAITGVTAGDTIVSIDRRPQNGMLYGLGYNSASKAVQLYLISSETGVATAIGSAGSFVDELGAPVSIGTDASTRFGIDFNPTVDRIRVVNTSGQNFRINPNTGALIDGNLNITPTPAGVNTDGAVNGSGITFVEEAAYTNNSPNQTVTTQYTIGTTNDSLYIQNPPNSGAQTLAVPLSSSIIAVRGFDIPFGVNVASSNAAVTSGSGFAVLELASNSQQRFCSVELASGVVSSSAAIPSATSDILGLSVLGGGSMPMIGLSADGAQLLRFDASLPSNPTVVAVSGVDASEVLVGLDFRPATGQLYSLGVNAAANTATLYMLDPQSGAASAVGSTGAVALVDTSGNPLDFPVTTAGWGFNFNPQVDRIRVVTSTGLNFRINPVTGVAVDSNGSAGTNPDGNINGSTTSVSAASYTNSFAGTAVTTLYTLDSVSDSLYIQSPPNDGAQTNAIALKLNGSSVDFSSVLGFEIPAETRVLTSNTAVTSGFAYVVLTVSSNTALYRLNLVTGDLTKFGDAPAISGLAVAQILIN